LRASVDWTGAVTARFLAISELDRELARARRRPPGAQLLPLVYEELGELAAAKLNQEKPGQTLQATAQVHEASLRLVGADQAQHWDNRGHFFANAAEAMRRILINRARDKKRDKRGGDRQRLDLDHIEIALDTPDEELIALDEALEALEREDDSAAHLVKPRFFGGLSLKEAAQSLDMPQRTAERQWAYARAWLFQRLRGEPGAADE
jgi:RNA polymerase sigma factor (TIGR02999 family)